MCFFSPCDSVVLLVPWYLICVTLLYKLSSSRMHLLRSPSIYLALVAETSLLIWIVCVVRDKLGALDGQFLGWSLV